MNRNPGEEPNSERKSEVPMRGAHRVAKQMRALTHRKRFAKAALALLWFSPVGQIASEGQASLADTGQHGAKYASAYNWIQSPAVPPALVAGVNTITLRPCPKGLKVADPPGLVSHVAP